MNLTAQDEIAVYVESVRQALAGLPAATRDELLEDLPEHLAEVLAEGGGSLTDRLGPPEAYAAELSASAGLGPTATTPPPVDARSRAAAKAAEHRARLQALLRRADVRIGPVLGYPRASDFLTLLRPAWWILRGYLAAMAVAVLLHDNTTPLGLLPRVGGADLAAVLLLTLGVLGSVWLGRRALPTRRWPRRLARFGTVFLVFFAIVGFVEADNATQRDHYEQVGYYSAPHSEIDDVYVYDGQGRLLTGVQLYDQSGKPILLGDNYCYDETTGMGKTSRSMGYPHCPGQAPFATDGRSAPAAPSASPTKTTTPAPSTGPSTGPSGSAPSSPAATAGAATPGATASASRPAPVG